MSSPSSIVLEGTEGAPFLSHISRGSGSRREGFVLVPVAESIPAFATDRTDLVPSSLVSIHYR